MRPRGATAFHFDMAWLKRPLLPCNCGSQTQLSKSVWGQMLPRPPAHTHKCAHAHTNTPHAQARTYTPFIYPFSLARCLFTWRLNLWCRAAQAASRTPDWEGHVANWILAGHLLLPSEQEEKKNPKKTETENSQLVCRGLGKKRNATPVASKWGEEEASESHLIRREERQEKRGLGLFGSLQQGSAQQRGSPAPRANAPIQAARHLLCPTLPVSGRAASEIRKVKTKAVLTLARIIVRILLSPGALPLTEPYGRWQVEM